MNKLLTALSLLEVKLQDHQDPSNCKIQSWNKASSTSELHFHRPAIMIPLQAVIPGSLFPPCGLHVNHTHIWAGACNDAFCLEFCPCLWLLSTPSTLKSRIASLRSSPTFPKQNGYFCLGAFREPLKQLPNHSVTISIFVPQSRMCISHMQILWSIFILLTPTSEFGTQQTLTLCL